MAEGSRDDGEVRCGGGAVLGEIPAASAGMTELWAGVTEGTGEWRRGGGDGRGEQG